MLCRISTSHLTVVPTLFCCCVLFRNNCPALLWLLLFPKSRPCPGRFWPFLAVSRFCQMASPTSPPVASWGSASRQSAKQTVYCLWCGECGAMSETLSASYHCAAVRAPAAINLSDTPWFSSSCCQVKWGCGLDSGKGICAVYSRTLRVVATTTAVGDLSLWSALSSLRTALYAWLRRPLPSAIYRSGTVVTPHGAAAARFGTAGAQLGACALGACALGVRVVATTTAVGDLSLWSALSSLRTALGSALPALSSALALLALALSAYACCDDHCRRRFIALVGTVVTPHGTLRVVATTTAVGDLSLWHCRHSARRCRSRFGTAGAQLGACALGACALGVRVVATTTAVGDLSLWSALSSLRTALGSALPALSSALALLALALSAYACCDGHCRRRFIALVGTVVTPHGTLRVVATTTAVGDLSLWSALSSLRTALYAWLRRPLPSAFIALVGTVVTPYGTAAAVGTAVRSLGSALPALSSAPALLALALSALACALGACLRSRRLRSLSALALSALALSALACALGACALSALACSRRLRSLRLLALSALACALGACLRSRRLLALSALALSALACALGACALGACLRSRRLLALSALACALGACALGACLRSRRLRSRRLLALSALACALGALALSALLRSRRLLALSALARALGACLRSRRLLALSALALSALACALGACLSSRRLRALSALALSALALALE